MFSCPFLSKEGFKASSIKSFQKSKKKSYQKTKIKSIFSYLNNLQKRQKSNTNLKSFSQKVYNQHAFQAFLLLRLSIYRELVLQVYLGPYQLL